MNSDSWLIRIAFLFFGVAALVAAASLFLGVWYLAGGRMGPDAEPATVEVAEAPADPATATVEAPTSAPAEAATLPAATAGATRAASPTARPTEAFSEDTPVPVGPTARLSPTPGPSPTPRAIGAQVVEDWSGYADDDALEEAYSLGEGWADNEVALSLLPAEAAPRGPAGAALRYLINAQAPSDYVGADHSLGGAQDWREFDHLAVWASPSERSNRQLVVQFREISGEVWRHRAKLGVIPEDGLLLIPLVPSAWEWADWSDYRNGALDLEAVTDIGLYVGHAGPGQGVVNFGTIELVQGTAGD